MTGLVEAARDIAQECFLQVLRRANRFNPARGTLRTYLYMAVRNLALAEIRKGGTMQGLDSLASDVPETKPGPEHVLLEIELSAVVQRAISSLPEGQRAALMLFEYEELSLEEIAGVLEIEAGAVKSRIHRARENLKRLLAPYFASYGEAPIERSET
jgi:RNA polymerase sigma-70 factor (ECF subfamily)